MTRWIVIATVKSDAQLLGWRGELRGIGYWLNWRGRKDWCQPCEFPDWPGVVWAVERRCAIAGMEVLSWAMVPPRREYQALWVEVGRRPAGRFKMKNAPLPGPLPIAPPTSQCGEGV